jgi:hypothetical protein
MTIKNFIKLISDFPEDTEIIINNESGYTIKYHENIINMPPKGYAICSSIEKPFKRTLIITTY